MENLPLNDIPMLVSSINFLLRDEIYSNLDEICAHFGVSRTEIDAKLASAGFEYNAELNKVW